MRCQGPSAELRPGERVRHTSLRDERRRQIRRPRRKLVRVHVPDGDDLSIFAVATYRNNTYCTQFYIRDSIYFILSFQQQGVLLKRLRTRHAQGEQLNS
jgi:hypothetical protein